MYLSWRLDFSSRCSFVDPQSIPMLSCLRQSSAASQEQIDFEIDSGRPGPSLTVGEELHPSVTGAQVTVIKEPRQPKSKGPIFSRNRNIMPCYTVVCALRLNPRQLRAGVDPSEATTTAISISAPVVLGIIDPRSSSSATLDAKC